MNNECGKPNYASIDDVIKKVVEIAPDYENIDKLRAERKKLCDDMEACGWFQPSLTVALAGILAFMPEEMISKEQFILDHILKPCPAFTAAFNALP